MLRYYKYRIYPTEAKRVLLEKHFGACRWVYNWALETRTKIYQESFSNTRNYALGAMLTVIKKDSGNAWLSEVNSQALQWSLANLELAYSSFFKRKSKFPRFKSKRGRQGCGFPQKSKVDFDGRRVWLMKIGWISASISRKFTGSIRTVVASRDPSGKYYVAVLVETGDGGPLPAKFNAQSSVGIDLGITQFATLSTGEKIANPRFLKSSLENLAKEQRRLSRKTKGSKNRDKQRVRVALAHEKIRNQRSDFLHKLSTRIIRENQAVALEDLNVQGMQQNRRLARSISDASWSEFVRQLEYKAQWCGKTVLRIGRFDPSSKLCKCGVINRTLKLSDRVWTCDSCGATHDRDVLAANNIKHFALGRGTPELTPAESSRNKGARRSRNW